MKEIVIKINFKDLYILNDFLENSTQFIFNKELRTAHLIKNDEKIDCTIEFLEDLAFNFNQYSDNCKNIVENYYAVTKEKSI